jgi:hypothetical protein
VDDRVVSDEKDANFRRERAVLAEPGEVEAHGGVALAPGDLEVGSAVTVTVRHPKGDDIAARIAWSLDAKGAELRYLEFLADLSLQRATAWARNRILGDGQRKNW